MEYKKRLNAPSTTDKHWIHTSKGGLNSCILIKGDSVLPNCVGYAWGRAYELLGEKPKLSRADAEKWYTYNDGYKRGQEPKLGAIACWKNDFGHVAVVEEIKEDGTIVTSESVYGGARFRTMTYKPPYVLASKYDFQGFIYIGEWEEPKEEVEPTPSNEYKVVAGDTLSEIAVKYNTTIEELMNLNPEIEDANKIYVGQVIEVPSDEIVYYTVKSGDTLSGIANEYNTTWEKIYEDNKKVIGDNPNLIQPGQKLIIK